jgi:hypothetical protein
VVGLTQRDLFPTKNSQPTSKSSAAPTLLRLKGKRKNEQPSRPFDWRVCVDAFTKKHLERLSDWRGYSGRFCSWLHNCGLVGLHDDCIAFPVEDKNGHVIAAHCRPKSGKKWFYEPGVPIQPFIIGDLKTAKQVHLFESQWDMFALMDRTELYLDPTVAFVATRGNENAKLIKGLLREGVSVCAWSQNDDPGKKWLKDFVKHADVPITKAIVPAQHKDLNNWTRAGATSEDLFEAKRNAETIPGPPPVVEAHGKADSEPPELPPPPPP